MASTPVNFTEIEKEVIYLKATAEMIDEMINCEVLDLFGADPDTEVSFKSTTHERYFNIILVDFLSRSDDRVVGKKTSYLDAVRGICGIPNFDNNRSVDELASTTNEFNDWLEHKFEGSAWMPSMNTERHWLLTRREWLSICGNISKHNFSRLGSVALQLKDIFERNGIPIDIHGALGTLYEFDEQLHPSVSSYHGNAIAEFLNNIRWGIHEYLQPEFRRSFRSVDGDGLEYRYTYPEGVVNEFAKKCYWDLMNTVRHGPILRKFVAAERLKSKY